MKVKTNVKCGGMRNHNQTLKASGLPVRTSVKSGACRNHNQTLKGVSDMPVTSITKPGS